MDRAPGTEDARRGGWREGLTLRCQPGQLCSYHHQPRAIPTQTSKAGAFPWLPGIEAPFPFLGDERIESHDSAPLGCREMAAWRLTPCGSGSHRSSHADASQHISTRLTATPGPGSRSPAGRVLAPATALSSHENGRCRCSKGVRLGGRGLSGQAPALSPIEASAGQDGAVGELHTGHQICLVSDVGRVCDPSMVGRCVCTSPS